MNFIIEFIKTEEFLIIIFFINIILVILVNILIYLVINNTKIYSRNKINLENNNIDNILKKHTKELSQIKDENEKLKDFCKKLDNNINKAIQGVGIVKYNAFDNIVGNLSFAIALLDRKNSGIIINGIYGLQSCNLYVKPIEEGKSKIELSEEERKALQQAMKEV